MYSSKTKARTSRINSTVVIVVSLLMVAIVFGGLAYAATQFAATVSEMKATYEQAGQAISSCLNSTTN